jgi:hypothetical protein
MVALMSKVTVLKNEFGHLEYELEEGVYYIHLQLYKWSTSLYKQYKTVFEEWLLTLPVQSVFCIIPAEDVKLQKFETMFGFRTLSVEDGQRLMVKDRGE